jgi:sulfur carrier protein
MQVNLNGTPHDLPENASIHDLLTELGLADKRLAVEVNCEIVPRSNHQSHRLNPDDKVEIVHAIGGG